MYEMHVIYMRKLCTIFLMITLILLTTGCSSSKYKKFAKHLESKYGFKCEGNYSICQHEDKTTKTIDKLNIDYQKVIEFDFKNNVFKVHNITKSTYKDQNDFNILFEFDDVTSIYNYKTGEIYGIINNDVDNAFYNLNDNILTLNYKSDNELTYYCSIVEDTNIKRKCRIYNNDVKNVDGTAFKQFFDTYSVDDIIYK